MPVQRDGFEAPSVLVRLQLCRPAWLASDHKSSPQTEETQDQKLSAVRQAVRTSSHVCPQASSSLRCSPLSWATGWRSATARPPAGAERPGLRASARKWTCGRLLCGYKRLSAQFNTAMPLGLPLGRRKHVHSGVKRLCNLEQCFVKIRMTASSS